MQTMKEHAYFVYILSNKRRRLYVGVTNSLIVRVQQHKSGKDPHSFSARYRIHSLVYFECFQYIDDAIRREKELKGWPRERKIALIVLRNPTCTISAKTSASRSSPSLKTSCALPPPSKPRQLQRFFATPFPNLSF